jgi:hypothetical protein
MVILTACAGAAADTLTAAVLLRCRRGWGRRRLRFAATRGALRTAAFCIKAEPARLKAILLLLLLSCPAPPETHQQSKRDSIRVLKMWSFVW